MDGKYAQFSQIKSTEHEPTTDYEDEIDETNIMPSIRDNEYAQHSSLWGAQYMSGRVKFYFLIKYKDLVI